MCEVMENMIAEAVSEATSKVISETNTKAVINMLRLKVDEMKSKSSTLLNLKKVREDFWKNLSKLNYC